MHYTHRTDGKGESSAHPVLVLLPRAIPYHRSSSRPQSLVPFVPLYSTSKRVRVVCLGMRQGRCLLFPLLEFRTCSGSQMTISGTITKEELFHQGRLASTLDSPFPWSAPQSHPATDANANGGPDLVTSARV